MAARFFQETDLKQESVLPVQVARFPPGLHDGAWTFDPSEGRDLSLYEFGGHHEECARRDPREQQECLKTFESVRKFVYHHWREKVRGYVEIDLICADCLPTAYIFIEPDEVGAWRVLRVVEEPRYPARYYRAYDLRYRPTSREERDIDGSSRVLSLLDLSGVEVDYF